VDAPAAVLALVLATTAVGSSVLLWAAPTWGVVRHGYEMLTGATVVLIAWGAWASLRAPVTTLEGTPQASDGALAETLLLTLAIGTALAVLALAVKVPPIVARVLGIGATLAGLASFVPLAAIRTARGGAGGTIQGVVELALGATLMGAIWIGMILGHW
jgi:hypothetical protein